MSMGHEKQPITDRGSLPSFMEHRFHHEIGRAGESSSAFAILQ